MSRDELLSLWDPMGPGDPYEKLALHVILKCLLDWQRYRTQEPHNEFYYAQMLDRCGFRSARQELVHFLNGSQCKFLVESLTAFSHEEVLGLLGIPRGDMREWGWAVQGELSEGEQSIGGFS